MSPGADNRLIETSLWDDRLLGEQLKELSLLDLDFSISKTANSGNAPAWRHCEKEGTGPWRSMRR
jgi:hypothetical protein